MLLSLKPMNLDLRHFDTPGLFMSVPWLKLIACRYTFLLGYLVLLRLR